MKRFMFAIIITIVLIACQEALAQESITHVIVLEEVACVSRSGAMLQNDKYWVVLFKRNNTPIFLNRKNGYELIKALKSKYTRHVYRLYLETLTEE